MTIKPRPLGTEEQLLFLHIRKTAGTSLIRLLDQHFIEDELCPVDWPYRQILEEISPEEIQRARFVRGHFNYDGVITMFTRPPRIVTMFRNPVERFVSEFEHIRRIVLNEVPRAWMPDFARNVVETREQELKRVYQEVAEQRMELADFIQATHLHQNIANAHVKTLNEQGDITKAKQRLDTLEFVGIAEEFRRSVELLCFLLGLPEPAQMGWYNRAPKRRKHGNRWVHSGEIQRQIAQIEALDLELYAYARERFERDYAAMQQMKSRKHFYVRFARSMWDSFAQGGKEGWWCDLRRVPIGVGWSTGTIHPKFGILRPLNEGRKAHWFVDSSTLTTAQIMIGLVVHGDPARIAWHAEVNGFPPPWRLEPAGRHAYVGILTLPKKEKENGTEKPSWDTISFGWTRRPSWKTWFKKRAKTLAQRLTYHPCCRATCQRLARRLAKWARQREPSVMCQWIAGLPHYCTSDRGGNGDDD